MHANKRAGLPVGLPGTHKAFSREYSEHWFGLMAAAMLAVDFLGEKLDKAK